MSLLSLFVRLTITFLNEPFKSRLYEPFKSRLFASVTSLYEPFKYLVVSHAISKKASRNEKINQNVQEIKKRNPLLEKGNFLFIPYKSLIEGFHLI